MIQRIQSVYLLLSSLCIWSLFLMPFSFLTVNITTNINGINEQVTDGIFNIYDNKILLVATAIVGALVLAIIFLFNNRKNQVLMSRILLFMILLLTLASIYLTFTLRNSLILSSYPSSFGLGFVVLIASIVFLFLAIMSILKDENIVKSMDRLR